MELDLNVGDLAFSLLILSFFPLTPSTAHGRGSGTRARAKRAAPTAGRRFTLASRFPRTVRTHCCRHDVDGRDRLPAVRVALVRAFGCSPCCWAVRVVGLAVLLGCPCCSCNLWLRAWRHANRDRGEPCGSAPPTPPDMRVRIRRFGQVRRRSYCSRKLTRPTLCQ